MNQRGKLMVQLTFDRSCNAHSVDERNNLPKNTKTMVANLEVVNTSASTMVRRALNKTKLAMYGGM